MLTAENGGVGWFVEGRIVGGFGCGQSVVLRFRVMASAAATTS